MHSFPSTLAHRNMCFPTGRPMTWSSEGNAKRKSLTSCEIDVLEMSLHGIFSRGLSATERKGGTSLMGAKWMLLMMSEFP